VKRGNPQRRQMDVWSHDRADHCEKIKKVTGHEGVAEKPPTGVREGRGKSPFSP